MNSPQPAWEAVENVRTMLNAGRLRDDLAAAQTDAFEDLDDASIRRLTTCLTYLVLHHDRLGTRAAALDAYGRVILWSAS